MPFKREHALEWERQAGKYRVVSENVFMGNSLAREVKQDCHHNDEHEIYENKDTNDGDTGRVHEILSSFLCPHAVYVLNF